MCDVFDRVKRKVGRLQAAEVQILAPRPYPSHCRECQSAWVLFTRSNTKRILNVGALGVGVHPFSFRTRQLSSLPPKVLRKGQNR